MSALQMCQEPTTVTQEHCTEHSGDKYSKIMALDIFSLTAKSIHCFSCFKLCVSILTNVKRAKITCLPVVVL